MKNKTLELVWLIVEVFCIARSAVATYSVTMSVSNGDVIFSAFTVAVVELSLFSLLLMSSSEAVAPIGALLLIAFSGVLQFCEVLTLQNLLDAQAKEILRYAVSFAPTMLLLLGLVKRLTSSSNATLPDVVNWVSNLFATGQGAKGQKTFASDVELPRGKAWKETRVRYRDAHGRKKTLPKARLPRGK